jgi:MoaA/NifB/PqqE/SkfB family radical SAM enzyme
MLLPSLRTKFRDKILKLADECGITSVKVFGFTVRGNATEKSDVALQNAQTLFWIIWQRDLVQEPRSVTYTCSL